MADRNITAEQRRERMVKTMSKKETAISGAELSKTFGVSRQIVVQDIAILRAAGHNIISTNKGYVLLDRGTAERTFKVRHTADEIEEEMNMIVDMGGYIKDVFIYHKLYNVIKAPMDIRTKKDVYEYVKVLKSGISQPLLEITDNYHYHTIEAESEEALDKIQEALQKRGFLAQLRDFEPVDFWSGK